jgi:RNA-directed DNA polymerase
MDLANFFPSVKGWMVRNTMVEKGVPLEVAKIVTRLVTKDRRLPQGAPTSPVIARIVVSRTLDRIQGLLETISPYCRATLYVDDLAISGPEGLQRCIPSIKRIFRESGLEVHKLKTHVRRQSEEQEVLGIQVNQGLRPSREFLERLAIERSSVPRNNARLKGMEEWRRNILAANKNLPTRTPIGEEPK